MADKRGVFRVNYYLGGQPATAFVCSYSDTSASAFLGVMDGSASVTRVAYPVEVDGVDTAHAAIPALAITVAPFDLPKTVSRAEFEALASQIVELQTQLNAKNTPASPVPVTKP